jgi:hypothetical protein
LLPEPLELLGLALLVQLAQPESKVLPEQQESKVPLVLMALPELLVLLV